MAQAGRGERRPVEGGHPLVFLIATLGVVTAALLARGGDTPVVSLLGGGALAGAGAIAARSAPVPPVFWSGAALATALGAVAAFRGGLGLAAGELGALAGAGGAFVIAAAAAARTADARTALRVLTWWFVLVLGAAFVAHAADPTTVLGRPKPYHAERLTGPFLSANTMATFCAIALCVGMGGAARAVSGTGGALRGLEALGRHGLGTGLLVLFALPCLLLTGSRAGVAAGLAGAGAIALWQARGRGRAPGRAAGGRASALVLLAAIGIVLAAASADVLGDRVLGDGADPNGRLILWRASLAAWAEAPLFGHGLGAYPRALATQVTVDTAAALSVQNAAHALPLQWLVQTGLLGTISGFAVLAHVAWTIRSGLVRRRRARSVLRVGSVALLVALLHGLVDYALEVPAVLWTLSILVGLAVGAAGGGGPVRERRARPAATSPARRPAS